MGRSCSACLVTAVMAAFFTMPINAQDGSWNYRVGAFYSASPTWLVNRTPTEVDWCPCDGRGNSIDHSIQLVGSVLRPDGLFTPVGWYASLGTAYSVGSFRSDPYRITPWYDQHQQALVFPVAEFRVSALALSLYADAGMVLALTPSMMFRLGGWMRYRVAGSFTHTEHLLSPVDQGFSASVIRERQLAEGSLLAAPRASWGPQLSASYLVHLSETMSIATEIVGQVNTDAIRSAAGLRAFGVGVGVSLSWSSIPEEESADVYVPISAPVLRIDASSETRPVGASIEMFTIGAKGERVPFGAIRSEQHYTREKSPVFPVVYFDRNSALIPARYRQLAQDHVAGGASKGSGESAIIDQYYDVLNILGQRMRDEDDAVLTITGYAAPEEPGSIAAARAEAVQLYLKNAWGIKSGRLRIESKPGKAPRPVARTPEAHDYRVVDCSSTSATLLAPLVRSFAVRAFQTAPIRLNPVIRTSGGVKEWTITITHKGKEIAQYSSREQSTNKDIDVSLLLKDSDGTAPLEPLHALLTVEDSNGVVITGRDVLDFKQSHDLFPSIEQERVSTSTTFIVPSPLHSVLSNETRYILEEAVASIRGGDRVRIYPLLERTGAVAMTTEQEARRHVQYLANLLLIELGAKKPNIVLGQGEYTLPRETQLPELGYLSSLLCITVEHGMK